MIKKALFAFSIILSLLACTLLPATPSDDDEIVVRLSTDSPLLPLYLTRLAGTNSNFDHAYLDQLEKVLNFDLSHNGMTTLVDHTPARNSQSLQSFDAAAWRNLNVFYVVKWEATGQNLSAQVFSVNSDSSRTVKDIPFSGNLSSDRRLIHELADNIHFLLFGKYGIAATHILYTVENPGNTKGNKTADIWEADYDGANARQITNEGAFCVNPSYIPPAPGFSSGNFFYVSYRIGQPKIYIGSLKEGKGRRFTLLRGNQFMPVMSPKRDKMAFISDAGGNPDIFLQAFSPEVGPLGKPRQIFSAPGGAQASPTFSPDGSRLAFVSNKDGVPRVYIMEIPAMNDSNPKATLMSKKSKESTSPAWSPDGTKLAYSAMTEGVRQIWICDMRSGQETQLTQGPGHKENPTWAPDSLHIVFNSANRSGCELYLVNLNQRDSIKISSGRGEKRFPSWEPTARAKD